MLEDHLKSPVTRRRLRASLVAPHIDAFADWLHQRGYAPITTDLRLRSLAAWAAWMQARGLALAGAEAGVERLTAELAAGRVRYARGPNDDSRVAAEQLIAFLREQGVLAARPPEPSPLDRLPVVAGFRRWTSQNRGLRETTLDAYQDVIVDLVAKLGEATCPYNSASLRAFVLARA